MSKIDENMPLVNVRQIPKFEVNRLSTLGGVRGHTDTHTDTHTHRHTEGLPALII